MLKKIQKPDLTLFLQQHRMRSLYINSTRKTQVWEEMLNFRIKFNLQENQHRGISKQRERRWWRKAAIFTLCSFYSHFQFKGTEPFVIPLQAQVTTDPTLACVLEKRGPIPWSLCVSCLDPSILHPSLLSLNGCVLGRSVLGTKSPGLSCFINIPWEHILISRLVN